MLDPKLLYEGVRDVRISAPLDMKKTNIYRITNPTELLFDDEKNRMARYYWTSLMPYERASDYERFSLLVSNMPNMVGSGVRELFCEELSLLFGYNKKLSCETVDELWQTSCSAIEASGYNVCELLSKRGITQHDPNEVYGIRLLRRYAKCYLDYLDEIEFELSKNDRASVYINASDISFVKSDIYHCEEAYKRFASCRDYAKEDENTLICGMLYSICEILKKEKRALWLYVGDNLSSVERILTYLSERGVLPVVYAVLPEQAAKSGAARLSRISGVTPAFVYEMGDTSDSIARKLLAFASVYPISLVRYGGIFGTVALPAAAHNIVKLGICKALCEVCDDIDTATAILKSILK